MRLSEALARELVDRHDGPVFGLVGDANLFLVHALVGLRPDGYVAADTEAGAVQMAAGWAQVAGRPGVATVTHGPGLAHAVLALVDGVRSRTPLVLVAGDTSRTVPHPLQSIEQRPLVEATGAGFEDVTAAQDAVPALRRALASAVAQQRPVVVNIPVDLQDQDVEPAAAAPGSPPEPPRPADRDVEAAAAAIADAGRVVVVAGRGASHDDARAAVLALARRAGALVATTVRGKDLFRGEPEDVGIVGTLASAAALDALARADCVVVFGASLNALTTDRGRLLAGKRVVHCDIDAAQLFRNQIVGVALHGDAAVTARHLHTLLDLVSTPAGPVTAPAAAPAVPAPRANTGMLEVLAYIERLVDGDRTLVVDVGRFMLHALRLLHVRHARHYVHAAGFSAIGLGTATAIGAAVARPGHPCLLVCGDGGFVHGGLTELHTAVRLGLDLVVVVLNDGGYGAEHVQLRERGLDPALALFAWPDLAAVATALGGTGVRVERGADLAPLAAAYAARTGPLVVDVQVDPDRFPPLDG